MPQKEWLTSTLIIILITWNRLNSCIKRKPTHFWVGFFIDYYCTFTAMNLRFPREERLKSRKVIKTLFLQGRTLVKYPIKVYYIPKNELKASKATFAVPKKNFSHAVTRNRIKRQMREAYRLHKHLLKENNGSNFVLLFLYIAKEIPQYDQLLLSMDSLLKNLEYEDS